MPSPETWFRCGSNAKRPTAHNEYLASKNFLDKRGFKDEVLTNREVAIKLLQNSKEVISRISKDIIWVELSAILKNSFEHIFIHFNEKSIETIFSEERVSISTGLVQEVITFETPKKKKCLNLGISFATSLIYWLVKTCFCNSGNILILSIICL